MQAGQATYDRGTREESLMTWVTRLQKEKTMICLCRIRYSPCIGTEYMLVISYKVIL
jgi:hypothetical protein